MADPSEKRFVPHLASDPSSEPSLGGVSRRTVLKHVAAIGAGAALSTGSVLAAMPRVDSNPKRGRIDVHHHMLPPFYMDLRRAVPDVGSNAHLVAPKSIDDMEKNGVIHRHAVTRRFRRHVRCRRGRAQPGAKEQ